MMKLGARRLERLEKVLGFKVYEAEYPTWAPRCVLAENDGWVRVRLEEGGEMFVANFMTGEVRFKWTR